MGEPAATPKAVAMETFPQIGAYSFNPKILRVISGNSTVEDAIPKAASKDPPMRAGNVSNDRIYIPAI